MIGYGSNVYPVAEPVGKTPRDFGKNRPCGLCGKPGMVHRYATPIKVSPNVRLLLCPDCRASLRAGLVKPGLKKEPPTSPKRRTDFSQAGKHGPGRPVGKKLSGLAQLMKEGGWTRSRLALASGLSGPYIGELKRLDRGASVETMERLAGALGVEPEELRRL